MKKIWLIFTHSFKNKCDAINHCLFVLCFEFLKLQNINAKYIALKNKMFNQKKWLVTCCNQYNDFFLFYYSSYSISDQNKKYSIQIIYVWISKLYFYLCQSCWFYFCLKIKTSLKFIHWNCWIIFIVYHNNECFYHMNSVLFRK